MIYGYCRISTPAQSIERQERNIREIAPDAQIMREAFTGKVMNRPEWKKLMKHVQSGDTIIFDSVSRMARNAEEGIAAYLELMERGVELRFLKEPTINTEAYREALRNAVPLTGTAVDLILSGVNAYLKELAKTQIKLAFEQAQKEVDDLRQRTREGMLTAKMEGRKAGRKEGATVETTKAKDAKELIVKYYNVFGGKYNAEHTMHELEDKGVKISRNSFFKYVRELKETAGAAE